MATMEGPIQTPYGTQKGRIWKPMQVLGVGHYLTMTQNQMDDRFFSWNENVDLDVPVGTITVMTAITGWVLGHGSMNPDVFDPMDDNAAWQWNSADRPWGMGWASVERVDVNAPDMSQSPPRQTAQLQVIMHLCDYNVDDPWFGIV